MIPLKDWPEQDRPREKLLMRGSAALTDAELLAIFLRTGLPGKSALALAQEALQHFGGLRPLLNSSVEQFCTLKGLGQAKYVQLQATTELAKRAIQQQLQSGPPISNPQQALECLQHHLQNQPAETLMGVFLDTQNQVLAIEVLATGTLDHAMVSPRLIVERVVHHHAKSLILAHNHPSGNTEPSDADLHLTRTLQTLLEMMDVRLLDHLIVGSNGQHCALSQRFISIV